MATIINNPGDADSSGAGIGMILGTIALLVVVGLFFMYALPAMRAGNTAPQGSSLNVNVDVPAGETPTPTPTPSPAPVPTPAPTPAP